MIAGEVAPSYAVLDDDAFRRIHHMNAQIRLIFVMRDPVDRCWSTATNAYRKGRFSDLSLENFGLGQIKKGYRSFDISQNN